VTSVAVDLRHAARIVARSPGFTALAVAILATGIGAATVMFSLVQAVLLRTLPFDDPERVVWMYNLRTERDRAPLSIPDFEDYRREASTVSGLAVFTNWGANLTGDGPPERIEGVRVSGDFFQVLGARAFSGRLLAVADEVSETQTTVLTHGLWVRRFGADPRIVGRSVALNGVNHVVVGVLPPGFVFPFRDAEVAVPMSIRTDPRRTDRGANFLRAIARLAPGVTLSQAKSELNAIARRLQTRYPDENARKTGISLYPLHGEIVRDYKAILWTLLAAVGVLLAVACGNLANLLLVRAAGRLTELAVRVSLGATTVRLFRQLLAESAVIAAAGGVLGTALAAFALDAWRAWGPSNFPRMSEVTLSSEGWLFACTLSCLTALVCGGLPAWYATRDLRDLREGFTRTATAGGRHGRSQRAFVAIQVAAATVLLVGMALAARGFARLDGVSTGFEPGQALSLQLSLPPRTYANREALVRFFEALRDRLADIPGVERAGAVSLLPLSGLLSTMDIAFPDRPAAAPGDVPQAHFRVATPEYFAAAGIAVLEGRSFTDLDRAEGQPVAIVSRTFESRHWPGESGVGKFVQIVQAKPSPPILVVGVVNDVKHVAVDAPSTADLYVPLHQMPPSQAALLAARTYWVVRARLDSAALARSVADAVAHVDPGVAASSVRTLSEVRSASLAPRRLNVQLLEWFGDVAIVLCGLGVYSITAFAARMRRRELAIRAALGASRRQLALAMMARELTPVLLGTALGVSIALLSAPALFGTPFETDPRDVFVYLVVAIGMLALGSVATYLPVRHAGKANPVEILQ